MDKIRIVVISLIGMIIISVISYHFLFYQEMKPPLMRNFVDHRREKIEIARKYSEIKAKYDGIVIEIDEHK